MAYTAFMAAATARALVLSLAAVCLPAFSNVPHSKLFAEKPHRGIDNFASVSHPVESAAIALIAPGFSECLYDSSTGPCSTGKERDAETGLNFFGARYMSSAQGRFTSPDKPFYDWNPGDPQSWNLYAYVRNSPLVAVDPTGQTCVTATHQDGTSNQADDGDGKGCFAASVVPTKEGQAPSAADVLPQRTEVTGRKEVNNDALFDGWWSGQLPRRIDYGADDPATKQMMQSYNVGIKTRAYIRAGCPATADMSVGHFAAAVESFDRGIVGPPGDWNPTQFQVGGFSGSITQGSDGNVNYEVRNGMTNSSFLALNTVSDTLHLGLRGKLDNPNGLAGPRH